jgi:trk system potassium uptake protein TrkH
MNKKYKNPLRSVLLGFLSVIFIGSVLLFLPFSTKQPISFINAFFTSTSAVCVTGLSVVSIKNFTDIGQVIIMLLIQIGGLGYMSVTSFLLLSFKRKLSYEDKLMLKESLSYPTMHDLFGFFYRILLFVFISEFLGALLLSIVFYGKMGVLGIYYGIFHSISAFNNAGFSLFSDSLVSYQYNIVVNFVVMALIVIGGIGFLVVDEFFLYKSGKIKRFSVHTKLVLVSTVFLIIIGTVFIFLIERNGILQHRGIWQDLLVSLFQSVTTRTAGFNTVDISYMRPSTIFLFVILMFIGASPSGTGGGIKTTTAFVVFLSIYSYIRGEDEAIVFKRRIPAKTIERAFVIFSLSSIFIVFVAFILSDFEKFPFLSVLFETVSAISTVGLSVGKNLSLSAQFSDIGKLIIILLMFVGRVGIFTFSIALLKKRVKRRYRLPEGRVFL